MTHFFRQLTQHCVFAGALGLGTISFAAPIASNSDKVDLIQVQFALLHATEPSALTSEAWNNREEMRNDVRAAMERLESQDSSSVNGQNISNEPQELLAKLNRLIRSGRYDVLAATQWRQPRTQKGFTQKIMQPVRSLPAYDFAFGTLHLEQRNALVAKLDIKLINSVSLQAQALPNEQPDSLASDFSFQYTPLQPDTDIEALIMQDQTIKSEDIYFEKVTAENTTNEKTSLEALPSDEPGMDARTPIIFLEQQRQVELNKLHYFDHPVMPGFLLITKSDE